MRKCQSFLCEKLTPVQFHRYAFNYGGPLRKSDQMRNGSSLQVFAQALINVCYRLHAELDWNRGPNGEAAESPDGQCAPHAYVDAFLPAPSDFEGLPGRHYIPKVKSSD